MDAMKIIDGFPIGGDIARDMGKIFVMRLSESSRKESFDGFLFYSEYKRIMRGKVFAQISNELSQSTTIKIYYLRGKLVQRNSILPILHFHNSHLKILKYAKANWIKKKYKK